MATITIGLDEHYVSRLRHLAEQRGATIEQVAESLLETALANQQAEKPTSTLDLAGVITDPTIAPLTTCQIEEILADEHFEQAGKIRLLK